MERLEMTPLAIRRLRYMVTLFVVLGLIASGTAALLFAFYPPIFPAHSELVNHPVALSEYNWFDVGVVDANGDTHLDIFTSNHNARQSLLVGDGKGEFRDVISAWRLDQAPSYPGLEDALATPRLGTRGLYVYWRERRLYLHVYTGGTALPVAGSLRLPGRLRVSEQAGFDISITTEATGSELENTTVQFRTKADAQLVLDPTFSAVPIQLDLELSVALDYVFVGRGLSHPPSHRFAIALRDRHGMAWSDYDGDGDMDVYIARGGLFGKMRMFDQPFSDELLVRNARGTYMDRASELRLIKSSCPARQVTWVDYNGDQRLDLYVTCGRKRGAFANQLHRQKANGTFVDVAEEIGLDYPELGTALWLDVDNDLDTDLLWGSRSGLWLHRNQLGEFTKELVGSGAAYAKLSPADYDGDGDLDVFAAAPSASLLLVNDKGYMQAVDTGPLGLPSKAKTAQWLDYDLDGRSDLFVFPDGLFRQLDQGTFTKTGILQVRSPFWRFVEPRAIWFDYDKDGMLDVLLAHRYYPRPIQKAFRSLFPFSVTLLHNRLTTTNHWIQIELVDQPPNRQALGAKVSVFTPERLQLQEVGQAEGSHYSQGHYRLYFGLGRYRRPTLVRIQWPDGTVQELSSPLGDQLLIIRRSQS
ncbi:MAG: CRTAC1 family protein [Pseudomonadota bacterium]